MQAPETPSETTTSWTLPACLQALERGVELLLPNTAAARSLRRAYDAAQAAANRTAWQPAPARSWDHWTRALWNDLIVSGAETRNLLNPAQELHLWREIIAQHNSEDKSGQTLASTETLAALCRSAWSLACKYRCTADLRTSATNSPDSRTFAAWAEEFSRRCQARDLISPAALNVALAHHISAETLTLPPTIHLVSFETLPPAQTALLEAAQSRNTTLHQISLHSESPAPRRIHTTTPEETTELRTATRWLRAKTLSSRPERGARSGETTEFAPAQLQIAVLIPGPVSDLRPDLDPIFRELLTPELEPITADLSSTPWQFSSGPPLASLPIITSLLELARWTAAPLPIERISSLLLSPYFTQPPDPSANARFDAFGLRKTHVLHPELDLAAVQTIARRFTSKRPDTQPIPWLPAVTALASNPAPDRPYSDWTEHLRAIAKAAGWPGPRPLTASEFEATRAWDAVLDLVATLDFSGVRVPFREALSAIERAATDTPFAPPSAGASIHVMSLAEAEGQLFDAAIILRATDTAWPPAEAMNPLLGWPLQRRLHMPGTDPAETAARALAQAQNLLARCPDVLILHAAENSEGPTRPSPLIAALNIETIPLESLLPPQPEPTPLRENLVPDTVPIPNLPQAEVHGGARLLKLQAACGFRAFAEIRLAADDLESPAAGLDPRESGEVLHLALQHFWREVQTQSALRSMPTAERVAVLARCIRLALDKAPHPQTRWDEAYIALLAERLQRVLLSWLDHELARPTPFTVLDQERREEVTVGPLTLTVRMDRIDRIDQIPADSENDSTHGVLFIDYKTGSAADPKLWEGPRPDEPQLPLYSLVAEPGELRGLAFARIRAGDDKRWSGYTDRDGLLPSKGSKLLDLAWQTASWRAVLESLAWDFFNGRATVNPKSFPKTCAHCAQRILCRLDPTTLNPPEDEEDESQTSNPY
jgi:ATP-dependent helicase/nuclease subunit B